MMYSPTLEPKPLRSQLFDIIDSIDDPDGEITARELEAVVRPRLSHGRVSH